MAIGSGGEIGTNFTVWGKMSQEDRDAWFDYMRENWVPLQKGYATLVHKKENNPLYESKETTSNRKELREITQERDRLRVVIEELRSEVQRLSQIAKY